MHRCAALPIRGTLRSDDTEALLQAAVAGLGIVHLNLGRGKDVVVTPDQRPVIVDFQHHIQLPRWMKHLAALVAHFDFRAMSAAWRRYTLAVLQSEEASLDR